jgi:Spy/CpxP family protein refolding chaperone
MDRSSLRVIPLLSVVYAIVFLTVPASSAQSAPPGSGEGQPQTQSPAPGPKNPDDEKLNLTRDQKKQIRHIRGEFRPQIEAVREDSTLSARQKTAKLRELHREMHKQVMAVLTPEQQEIWKERQRERHAVGKPHFQSKPS